MCKICSFHGLTSKLETVLYAFLASGRSRNPTAFMTDSSLRQYLTVSSSHHNCAIHITAISPEIVRICTRVIFKFQLKIYRKLFPLLFMIEQQIPRKPLKTLGCFLTRNFKENWKCYAMFASPAFSIKGFQQRRNKNHRTGLNNQKQARKGVLNIE